MIYFIILCCFAGEIISIKETLGVLFGFLLLTMSYISFGGFISSLTDNPIIAGIGTIVLLLGSWFITGISDVLYILSPIGLFEKFPSGVISITDTVGLISQIVLFTLLTITVLQRRKNIK